ncbi:MAG TPA: hypothetical protein VIU40_00870 [Geobacteraceae bacterium]
MAVYIGLVDFLRLTGGEYLVTGTSNRKETHRFSFPNGSCIVSPPGRDHEDALQDAIEFVFSQVALPPEQTSREVG